METKQYLQNIPPVIRTCISRLHSVLPQHTRLSISYHRPRRRRRCLHCVRSPSSTQEKKPPTRTCNRKEKISQDYSDRNSCDSSPVCNRIHYRSEQHSAYARLPADQFPIPDPSQRNGTSHSPNRTQ